MPSDKLEQVLTKYVFTDASDAGYPELTTTVSFSRIDQLAQHFVTDSKSFCWTTHLYAYANKVGLGLAKAVEIKSVSSDLTDEGRKNVGQVWYCTVLRGLTILSLLADLGWLLFVDDCFPRGPI